MRAVGSCSITLNTAQSIEAVSTGGNPNHYFFYLAPQSIFTDYVSLDDFVLPADFDDAGVLSILVGAVCTVPGTRRAQRL